MGDLRSHRAGDRLREFESGPVPDSTRAGTPAEPDEGSRTDPVRPSLAVRSTAQARGSQRRRGSRVVPRRTGALRAGHDRHEDAGGPAVGAGLDVARGAGRYSRVVVHDLRHALCRAPSRLRPRRSPTIARPRGSCARLPGDPDPDAVLAHASGSSGPEGQSPRRRGTGSGPGAEPLGRGAGVATGVRAGSGTRYRPGMRQQTLPPNTVWLDAVVFCQEQNVAFPGALAL